MRAIRGAWSGDDRRMRGESQAGQNAIRKNAEIVTERDIDREARHGQTLNDAITCACTRARVRAWGLGGVAPKGKNVWNKWKNHFYEMKGDVRDATS